MYIRSNENKFMRNEQRKNSQQPARIKSAQQPREDERKAKAAALKKYRSKGKRIFLRWALALAVLGTTLCLIIYNDMRITTLAKETSNLKSKLETYKSEATQLKYEYEKVYSSTIVETYVRNNLGMQPLDKSQIEYVKFSNEDKVEIAYEESKGEILIISELLKGIGMVLEYLS